jgi:hypothetical protein
MDATQEFLAKATSELADLKAEGEPQAAPGMDDATLLDLFKRWKKESFDNRWIWERGWMRNIHYINNRHWIEYVRRSNEWRDVRLAKWFPKPVTPIIAQGVQALRAMFTSVNIGVNVRPNGSDPKNVAVAAIADEYGPVLHEDHAMEEVMDEADFWFIATGNVFLHTYLERDGKHGFDEITFESCLGCGETYESPAIHEAKNACPGCGAPGPFVEGKDPETGLPSKRIAKGKGVTAALSPFELAFPLSYSRFEDVPYVIRLRWRSKDYYENHPTLKTQMANYKWSKAPAETSLQLFRSLPYHNDMGVAPFLGTSAGGGEEEGAPEYEVWVRPCDQYPDGLVFRVVGDSEPKVLHLEEDEALPGPIPYKDAEGNALFTFTHASFEQRGGRVLGVSPLDGAIQKQNQLNQLDAFILMIINRMGNPLWLVPKGAEIEKFTGEPGLVVKWNPLTVGGTAKPERVDGSGVNGSLFTVREQYLKDLEEALGTYDVLKGTKPPGVDAFAALQLLVERGQSRFASAFKARGRMYRDWFKFALEIEREFGPDERTKWVLSPARGWALQVFQRAQLSGAFSIIVEEGSQTPKTALGMRAAIEHLNSLGFIDPTDPDQRYAVYEQFGMTKLSPALNIHVQSALRKQEAFEQWAASPEAQQESLQLAQQDFMAYQQQLAAAPPPVEPPPNVDPNTGAEVPPDPAQMEAQVTASLPPPPPVNKFTPLAWKPWFNARIHKQEYQKWLNGDRMVELLKDQPALEPLLVAHGAEIDAALMQEMAMAAGPQPPARPQGGQGAGRAMANSNQEAGSKTVNERA